MDSDSASSIDDSEQNIDESRLDQTSAEMLELDNLSQLGHAPLKSDSETDNSDAEQSDNQTERSETHQTELDELDRVISLKEDAASEALSENHLSEEDASEYRSDDAEDDSEVNEETERSSGDEKQSIDADDERSMGGDEDEDSEEESSDDLSTVDEDPDSEDRSQVLEKLVEDALKERMCEETDEQSTERDGHSTGRAGHSTGRDGQSTGRDEKSTGRMDVNEEQNVYKNYSCLQPEEENTETFEVHEEESMSDELEADTQRDELIRERLYGNKEKDTEKLDEPEKQSVEIIHVNEEPNAVAEEEILGEVDQGEEQNQEEVNAHEESTQQHEEDEEQCSDEDAPEEKRPMRGFLTEEDASENRSTRCIDAYEEQSTDHLDEHEGNYTGKLEFVKENSTSDIGKQLSSEDRTSKEKHKATYSVEEADDDEEIEEEEEEEEEEPFSEGKTSVQKHTSMYAVSLPDDDEEIAERDLQIEGGDITHDDALLLMDHSLIQEDLEKEIEAEEQKFLDELEASEVQISFEEMLGDVIQYHNDVAPGIQSEVKAIKVDRELAKMLGAKPRSTESQRRASPSLHRRQHGKENGKENQTPLTPSPSPLASENALNRANKSRQNGPSTNLKAPGPAALQHKPVTELKLNKKKPGVCQVTNNENSRTSANNSPKKIISNSNNINPGNLKAKRRYSSLPKRRTCNDVSGFNEIHIQSQSVIPDFSATPAPEDLPQPPVTPACSPIATDYSPTPTDYRKLASPTPIGRPKDVRGGKIDRVARFLQLQKIWKSNSFVRGIDGEKRPHILHHLFAPQRPNANTT